MKLVQVSIIAAAAVGVAVAQGGASLYSSYLASLQKATSLDVDFTVQTVGGAPNAYRLVAKKPNQLRLESPTEIIVADGKTVTTFNRAENRYYKRAQTGADAIALIKQEPFSIYAPFFGQEAIKPASTRDLGTRERGGKSYQALQAAYGKKSVTLFLDPADKVARQAQMEEETIQGRNLEVMNARSLSLGASIGADRFAFSAPSGAEEVTEAEWNSAKWFTSLEEARAEAAKTNKLIFADFMAEWCGPCKKMEVDLFPTDRFKALTKKVVLLKIDVDRQPAIARAYNIEAMPTQMVLNAKGEVVSKTVGYGDPAGFFAWIDPVLKN